MENTPKRRGRPPKNPEEVCSVPLTVSVTPALAERIRAAAAKAEISVSAFLSAAAVFALTEQEDDQAA